mmetsp:Transcript_46706/g.105572  ORF Transcript_46706/g.105572 Transcript_46706/m.105572 type:complete len:201 (+) Transcript_46706:334-936(+)
MPSSGQVSRNTSSSRQPSGQPSRQAKARARARFLPRGYPGVAVRGRAARAQTRGRKCQTLGPRRRRRRRRPGKLWMSGRVCLAAGKTKRSLGACTGGSSRPVGSTSCSTRPLGSGERAACVSTALELSRAASWTARANGPPRRWRGGTRALRHKTAKHAAKQMAGGRGAAVKVSKAVVSAAVSGAHWWCGLAPGLRPSPR